MDDNLPIVQEVNGIAVVRDDLFEGGTKRRVLRILLATSPSRAFVYAATAQGYGQLALALAARDVGKSATIFVAKRSRRHPLTTAASAAGARIIEYASGPGFLPNVERAARAYASANGMEPLPVGFNTPAFQSTLADIARRLDVRPPEVWAALGSGALISSLQQAWPQAACHGVYVGRKPELSGVTVHNAPEPFATKARSAPPFPSAPHQDAKVWQFVSKREGKGALFWNVAG